MSDERVDVRLRFYDPDFAALRETLDRMAKELSQLGKGANRSTDLLRYWAARDNNSRYWKDACGDLIDDRDSARQAIDAIAARIAEGVER